MRHRKGKLGIRGGEAHHAARDESAFPVRHHVDGGLIRQCDLIAADGLRGDGELQGLAAALSGDSERFAALQLFRYFGSQRLHAFRACRWRPPIHGQQSITFLDAGLFGNASLGHSDRAEFLADALRVRRLRPQHTRVSLGQGLSPPRTGTGLLSPEGQESCRQRLWRPVPRGWYGVTTKRFNEAFKRNRQCFPHDFAFQLTAAAFANLGSQFATLNTQLIDLK